MAKCASKTARERLLTLKQAKTKTIHSIWNSLNYHLSSLRPSHFDVCFVPSHFSHCPNLISSSRKVIFFLYIVNGEYNADANWLETPPDDKTSRNKCSNIDPEFPFQPISRSTFISSRLTSPLRSMQKMRKKDVQ